MNDLSKSFILVFTVCVFNLQGCASLFIDSAISGYELAAPQVKLGDPKEKVLPILEPTQSGLSATDRKRPESFLVDKGNGQKNLIEIYFYRSKRISYGQTTDDEFTPYTFTDGMLTGVGWTLLGGPKSVGQEKSGVSVSVGNEPRRNLSCFQNGRFINCQ